MARSVATDLTRLALRDARELETSTLALLRDKLPDNCTYFHGVYWTPSFGVGAAFGGERRRILA